MVFLNEWLPNPAGPDAAGEFVELYNGGASPVALGGWEIETEKGKSFKLDGRTIAAHGYLVLGHAATKVTLVNTDGGLALYAPGGALEDHAVFIGRAPEGKSFSRVDYAAGPAAHFAWSAPTPGAPNPTISVTLAPGDDRYGMPLGPQFTAADFFAIMMGTAALLAGLIAFIIKRHETLSKFFAARNTGVRGGDRERDGRGDAETREREEGAHWR